MIQHPAVLTTEAGWIRGKEVVKVNFDASIVSVEKLDNYALDQGFFLIEEDGSYQKDKNPQYYLKNSIYSFLPLNYTQRSFLNYAIPYQKEFMAYLSPAQLEMLRLIQSKKTFGEEL
jgi:hypothetical protein